MFEKLTDFVFTLCSLVKQEQVRRNSFRLYLRDSLNGRKLDAKQHYFSVVEITGDSIDYSLITFYDLASCYEYIRCRPNQGLDVGRTFGIVYHLGNERLTNKKIASCKLVCLFGFISVDTLKAIQNKEKNLY
jgi:hypothetical protein